MPSTIRFLSLSVLAAAVWSLSASRPPAAQLEKDPPALTAGQRNASMVVKVVRDGRPGCGGDCAEWIAMEGHIVPGVAADFERVLRGLHGRKLPVFIDSGGGTVRDAMAIGRAIRRNHLDVAVIETIGGRGGALAQEKGAVCASACVLVLAAGENRIVSPTAAVGVHQMTVRQTQVLVRRNFRVFYGGDLWGRRREIARVLLNSKPIAVRTVKGPASASTNREVARYLETMGIGPQLMPLMLSTPSDSIRWLNAGEMRTSALMTAQSAGSTLLAKADPQAGSADAPAAAASVSSGDAHLDILVGGKLLTKTGRVAWRLDRAEGRHAAIVADVSVPDAHLTLSLRLSPTSAAAAAPLMCDVVAHADADGRSRRIEHMLPLEARSTNGSASALTGESTATGDMAWQLKPLPDATIVGPGAPPRLGLRLVLDGRFADLSFADGAVPLSLYRLAAADWATEVTTKQATPDAQPKDLQPKDPPSKAGKPAAHPPSVAPMIKASAPWRSPA